MSSCIRRPFARLAVAACLLASALALASCESIQNLKIPGLVPGPQVVPPAPAPRAPPLSPAPLAAPLPAAPEETAVPPVPFVPPPVTAVSGKVSVAVLLPLSGASAALGQAMLNAAQMALYDLADDRLTLLTRDTKGTATGAAGAASDVIAGGAKFIIGPLLAAEVEAVKPIARAANVPVLAFSTATQLAGQGVYLMGFMPSQEVERVTAYAHAHGHDRFAVLAPRTAYGEVVVDAVRAAVAAEGATLARIDYYDQAISDMAASVRRFAAEGSDYDALVIPEGGTQVKALAAQLPYFHIDPDQVKFLGTGLWDEPDLGAEPALEGGWYAAPPPEARAGFEHRYQDLYGTAPPLLAALGYDATAVAAVLARAPQGPDFSDATLASPNGFAGVDGIFRFRPDGLVQRGLAVFEVHRGASTVIDPAPRSFVDLGY